MDHSYHRRHEHHLRKRIPIPDPQGGTKTVVEVVFVTQAPSDGEAGGTATANGDGQATAPTETVSVAPSSTLARSSSKDPKNQSVGAGESRSQTTFVKSAKSLSSSSVESSAFSTPTASRTSAFSSASGSLGSSTSSPSPSSTGAPTNSAGLTIGAYAGIVGGGVALLLVLIVAVAVCLKRKKNANYEKPEDEKNLNRLSFNDRAPPSPVPVPRSLAPIAAPKLEIRPITQFDDSFFPLSDTVRSEDKPIRAPPPALSMEKKSLEPGPFETPEPSPALSAFSDSSNMVSIQGAANAAPSPVHRIMVDFKPSMADELELTAGELVRMLHEYDDGWALCIRMDRTQQGVCPRSCLSERAVKPRPPPATRGPPPPQIAVRGPGGPPRPYSPSGQPQSPGFGPGSRPQSPRSPGPNRPPMSPKGMPGPPRRPMGPDSRPSSPMSSRQPHPLSKVHRDEDVQFHAM